MKDIEELIVYWLTAISHDDPKILTDKKYAQKVKKKQQQGTRCVTVFRPA